MIPRPADTLTLRCLAYSFWGTVERRFDICGCGLVVPGSVTALADRVSGPVAGAAAVVMGVLILVVWLARKVVHKIIGIAVSVGVATATHAGMQTWIHHLISTATHS